MYLHSLPKSWEGYHAEFLPTGKTWLSETHGPVKKNTNKLWQLQE